MITTLHNIQQILASARSCWRSARLALAAKTSPTSGRAWGIFADSPIAESCTAFRLQSLFLSCRRVGIGTGLLPPAGWCLVVCS